MSLKEWVENGWLVEHQSSREEIRDLLSVVERDLADCRVQSLSSHWRLSIAYNAALQAATAALAAAGYRASRDAHHFRVIQSLAHTVSADAKFLNKLDKFRKKRNIGGYERAGAVSDQEAREMLEAAEQLKITLINWMQKNHPGLI